MPRTCLYDSKPVHGGFMSNFEIAVDFLKDLVAIEGLGDVQARRSKNLEYYPFGDLEYCDAFCDLKIIESIAKGVEPNEDEILCQLTHDCGAEFKSYDELFEARTTLRGILL